MAVLHSLCGKMAAGKSTLARRLAAEQSAILICEDIWLQRLYPVEIATFDDYLQCAARLQKVVGPHVIDLLRAEVSVVMDFPANIPAARAWHAALAATAGARHVLHFVDTPDDRCLTRLHQRNRELPEGAMVMSDEQFVAISRLFQRPDAAEGLDIVVYNR